MLLTYFRFIQSLHSFLQYIDNQGKDNLIEPNTCALIIGFTFLISSIFSLILKNFIGRRILLLFSQTGMGLSMIALGIVSGLTFVSNDKLLKLIFTELKYLHRIFLNDLLGPF